MSATPIREAGSGASRPRLCSLSVLFLGHTLLLRKSNAQARIEDRESRNWPDDDYAVVEGTVIGRIYRELSHGENKSGDGAYGRSLRQVPKAGAAAQSRDGRYIGGGEGSVRQAL